MPALGWSPGAPRPRVVRPAALRDALSRACKLGGASDCRRAADQAQALSDPPARRLGRSLLTSACERGDGPACVDLAAQLGGADWLADQAGDRLGTYLRRACDANDSPSCVRFGLWLIRREGAGHPQAHRAFERGCELGGGPGCVMLARQLIFGHGVARDAERGMTLLEARCRVHDMLACADLLGTEARAPAGAEHWAGVDPARLYPHPFPERRLTPAPVSLSARP